MEHKERILFIVIVIVILSSITYLSVYLFMAPFLPAIIVHIIYVVCHILFMYFLKKGYVNIVKYGVILTYFIQLTLAAFFWFSKETYFGLFYYLVPIFIFATIDMSSRRDRFLSAVFIAMSMILCFVSLFFINSYYIYEMNEDAIKVISFLSIISTIGVATFIYYLYAINLTRKQKELEYLANTDTLTNTINRRSLFEIGDREFELASKYNYEFTLIALDIDYFKKINDTYGHHVGDEALVLFTQLVNKSIRKEDVFARHGGEEFTILIRKTTLEIGLSIAEKIRKSIEETPLIVDGHILKMTVSIGVVQYAKEYTDFDEMMIDGDRALYKAKDKGRNQVISKMTMNNMK